MLESNSYQHMESHHSEYVNPDLTLIYTDRRQSGYWAFLDFALALIPIDIVWKLKLDYKRKFLLSCLLGMGVL